MSVKQNLRGLVLAATAAVIYGTYPVIVQWVLQSGMTTSTVLFLRFGGCALILWAFCLSDKRRLKVSIKTIVELLLVGAVAYACMSALNLVALTRIPASLASLLLSAYPVFVTLIYVLLGKERLSWHMFFCLVTCVFGMYLVLDVQTGSLDIWGIVLAIAASFANACYIVIGSMIKGKVDPIMRATLIMTGSWMSYTISGLFAGEIRFDFALNGWLWIGVIVVFSTVLPVILFWAAVERIGALSASIPGVLEPVATVVLSVILLNEAMKCHQMIGVFVVIFGVVAIQLLPIAKKTNNLNRKQD